MPKNILIYSDGTGQIGGIQPDQRLSNIYKLYRASRPGPENDIDPREQVAFYDPGLGADVGGGWTMRRIRNIFASAFGTGISENIVDCYEAILRHYDPGDRIYIFGFSRGAYTARCVANVLNLCGVPTHQADGSPLPRYGLALRRIAEDAVYTVYEHGSGKARADYEDEREEQGRRYRTRYGSAGTGLDGEAQGNVAPEFIGVFDTVAALGTATARWIISVIMFLSVGLAALAYFYVASWLAVLLLIPTGLVVLSLLRTVRSQFKSIRGFPTPSAFSWHFAAWNLKNYDRFLDNNVRFARHALSIDESRAKFPRVGWGHSADVARLKDRDPPWLDQVWFAGNHSDIGGSYPEAESRLSDIALEWMLKEMELLPCKPLFNRTKLAVYPSAAGLQHDEIRGLKESWPRWIPQLLRPTWRSAVRKIDPGAKLHPSVFERFDEALVPTYDKQAPYRPAALSRHTLVRDRYDSQATHKDEVAK